MPEKSTDPKGGQGDPETEDGGTPELVFETWIADQPEGVKQMMEKETSNLKSALTNERDRAKKLEKDLRDAAKNLEEGSDARKKVEEMADQLAAAEKEKLFYDQAHKSGAKNLRLAWIAANEADLVRNDGSCDFAALKEQYPELFGSAPPPKGKPGSGTNNDNAPPASMNAFIRKSAGREPTQT